MEPRIDQTQFGSVTIDGAVFTHDVIIRLDGQVEKRNKKLSKAVYGTSHTISLAEAKHLYQKGAARLLIGAGQYGTVTLSQEAAASPSAPPSIPPQAANSVAATVSSDAGTAARKIRPRGPGFAVFDMITTITDGQTTRNVVA